MTEKAKKEKAVKPVPAQAEAPAPAPVTNDRGRQREREGVVVSNKMEKTIVVVITRRFAHPAYGRVVEKRSKAYAHDEKKLAQVGDRVRIVETRPISKTKRWKLVEVIK